MDCGIARRERVRLLGGRERRITAALVLGGRAVDCRIARREKVGMLGGLFGGRERRITAALVVGSARWEVGERWTAGLLGGRE